MKIPLTIEEAINLKNNTMRRSEDSIYNSVITEILLGGYRRYGNKAAIIAQEDIDFLTREHEDFINEN